MGEALIGSASGQSGGTSSPPEDSGCGFVLVLPTASELIQEGRR